MTAGYFRALASQCRNAARDCFDLYAKEEFRRLACEFEARASELEASSNADRWGLRHSVLTGSGGQGAYRQNAR